MIERTPRIAVGARVPGRRAALAATDRSGP